MVFAVAMGVTCGGGDTQTGDLRTETEWCTGEHDDGSGEGKIREKNRVVVLLSKSKWVSLDVLPCRSK